MRLNTAHTPYVYRFHQTSMSLLGPEKLDLYPWSGLLDSPYASRDLLALRVGSLARCQRQFERLVVSQTSETSNLAVMAASRSNCPS